MTSYPPPNSGQWTTGFCGCCEDCETCWCVLCCPCVLVGRYIEILDQGATSACEGCLLCFCLQFWTGCGFLYTCGYRARLRQKFGLPPSPCGDCLTEFCCPGLSECQIYRELKNRGIDPALGYAAVKQVYEAPAAQFMDK